MRAMATHAVVVDRSEASGKTASDYVGRGPSRVAFAELPLQRLRLLARVVEQLAKGKRPLTHFVSSQQLGEVFAEQQRFVGGS